MTPPEEAPKLARSPLSYPAFRVLWLAGIVSYIGSFVQTVGEAWLMMDLTKSPLPVAILSTAFVGASLLMTLPAGVLADRYDRRTIAFVAQIVQMAAAMMMAVLSFTGHITPGALVFGVALLGFGMALGAPAWVSLVPDLVPRELMAEAVSLNSVAFNLARTVGPAIGGLVLSRFGATTSFVLNGVSFAVVMVGLRMHRKLDPPRRPTSMRPLASMFGEPWAVAARGGEIRATILAMLLFSLGAGMFYALTPAFAKDTLGAGARSYGLMIGAMGAGAVVGASIMKRLRHRLSPHLLVAATMAVFAGSVGALARVSSVPVAMALLVPAGAGWLGSFSSLQALVQLWAPERLRARILALYQVFHLAAWASASAVGGVLADRHGIRAAITTAAVVCAIAAASTWKLGLPRSFTGAAHPV